jgi:hypothetical protein
VPQEETQDHRTTERASPQSAIIGVSPTLWCSCSRRFSYCSTDFSQQIAQVVLFLLLFMFLSFNL